MGTYENIYLYTAGLNPDLAARSVAAAINANLRHHPGGKSTTRRPIADRPSGFAQAQIEKSLFLEDAPRRDHPSVIDLYDINCDVWCIEQVGDEFRYLGGDIQQAEAVLIFEEIIDKLAWPAVLLHDNGLLVSAWAPAIGRTDFPPGSTPDEEHQHLWARYADPAALTHPQPGT